MRIGSLFSGAGALDLAVEAAFQGRTVWHVETDPNAARVLAIRFPGVPNLGDISLVDWSTVEPVDILCGGFPCQDVSSAGRRAGIAEGTRSGLWSQFSRAIHHLHPSLVVIENVRGLLSAKANTSSDLESRYGDLGGRHPLRAAGAVLGDLADLGYDARWTTVSASSIGAPHRRERVFIVAHPAGEPWWVDPGDTNGAGLTRWIGRDPVKLLPTPTASGHPARSGLRSRELLLPGLACAATTGSLLPTPTTRDHRGINPNRQGGPDLPSAVVLLRTPQTGYTGTSAEAWRARRCNGNAFARLGDLRLAVLDVLPTPKSTCSGPDYGRASRSGSGGDDLVTTVAKATLGQLDWGKYEPAVRRWESLLRPTPYPVEPNSKGKPCLAPVFPEWMMGWPQGWVTAVPGISRTAQLKIIGNGVVPQQAYAALEELSVVLPNQLSSCG